MVPLLTVDHEFEFGEFLSHRQHFFLIDLFVASLRPSRLLIISCAISTLLILIEGVLSETARVAHS